MRRSLALGGIFSLLPAVSRAVFKNDFSLYPINSQECLYAAATSSGCGGDTAVEMNSCLCSNGGDFVTDTAACLGTRDTADLGAVYDTMDQHCTYSNTPLAVSRAQFLKAGAAAETSSSTTSPTTSAHRPTSSSSSASSTATTTTTTNRPTSSSSVSSSATTTTSSTTTSSTATTSDAHPAATGSGNDKSGGQEGDDEGKKGLSGAARAWIIGGAVGGGVLLLGLAAFCLIRRRKGTQSGREETHPMLFWKFGGGGVVGGAHDGLELADAADASGGRVSVSEGGKRRQSQHINWESPYSPPPWTAPGQDAAASMTPAWSAIPAQSPPTKPGWSPSPQAAIAQNNPHVGHHYIETDEIHELASPEAHPPIELAATPLDARQYSGADWGMGR